MVTSLRAVGELRNNAIRDRHWKQLMKTTGVTFVITEDMKFQDLLRLQLHRYEDEVKGIVDRATKELSMEKVLSELDKTWSIMEFTFEPHTTGISLIKASEELIETLEDNQVMLQNLMTSKYVSHFLEQITHWQNILSSVDSVTTIWQEVQQTWSHLENIFKGSEDIRISLPEDTKRFDSIDEQYRKLMVDSVGVPKCTDLCVKDGLYEFLERLQGQLALCEKSLAEYLETKRLAFPRFYFVSGSDLLDILAKGNMPQKVMIHLPKLFDNIARLEFEQSEAGAEPSKRAIGMYSREDEYVPFSEPCECTGAVEVWLNRLVDTMRKTLRHSLGEAVVTYEEKPREQWIFDFSAQITLAGTQIWWTTEVNAAFGRLEEGYENAMKDYYKKQCNQLTNLITLVQGDLSKGNRQMIMTICTLDVHARDMVAKLIQEKADNAQCFSWQSQLRLRWEEEQNDCFINICDAHFRYSYEYLGNTPRLVVTPLTDRCYITLTQALHLIMGGAPAGPAGTGKTETTKDLGRALAIMVYVFNCSEQMDYKSVGNIFKGLAQSGTWGVSFEYHMNSTKISVFRRVQPNFRGSLVRNCNPSQVDSRRPARKEETIHFPRRRNWTSFDNWLLYYHESYVTNFGCLNVHLLAGYAGRAELPDNLKALFRPCSMVVPDLQLICEIMVCKFLIFSCLTVHS
jgi:dynein heavy chain